VDQVGSITCKPSIMNCSKTDALAEITSTFLKVFFVNAKQSLLKSNVALETLLLNTAFLCSQNTHITCGIY
jgi:hypothetical protein